MSNLILFNKEKARFAGRVVTLHADGYGYIATESVKIVDGEKYDTNGDVYFHRENCKISFENIIEGDELSFTLIKNPRDHEKFRAMEIMSTQMSPAHLTEYGSLYMVDEEAQAGAKSGTEIPLEDVKKAEEQKPFEDMAIVAMHKDEIEFKPKTQEEITEIFAKYLRKAFPGLDSIGLSYNILEIDLEKEQELIDKAIKGYEKMGFTDQIEHLKKEYQKLSITRDLIVHLINEDLLQNGSMVPFMTIQLMAQYLSTQRKIKENQLEKITRSMKFLQENQLLSEVAIIPAQDIVDLLVTAPVWFVEGKNIIDTWENTDPEIDNVISYFCDVIGTQNFANLYQIYNRRTRPFKLYQGDIIPTKLIEISQKAKEVYDYLIIATPYHDMAGREWEDPDWLRNIDPFLIGVMKDIPFLFFLGRWSDTGLFKMVPEMIADTINHLRVHKDKLKSFTSAYWYFVEAVPYIHREDGEPSTAGLKRRNRYISVNNERYSEYPLITFANKLIQAFDEGHLFPFLRGEKGSETKAMAEIEGNVEN